MVGVEIWPAAFASSLDQTDPLQGCYRCALVLNDIAGYDLDSTSARLVFRLTALDAGIRHEDRHSAEYIGKGVDGCEEKQF